MFGMNYFIGCQYIKIYKNENHNLFTFAINID